MNKASGFHCKDGWFFERLDNGFVSITTGEGESMVLKIDPTVWASIMASVSKRGENGETFDQAVAFHGN